VVGAGDGEGGREGGSAHITKVARLQVKHGHLILRTEINTFAFFSLSQLLSIPVLTPSSPAILYPVGSTPCSSEMTSQNLAPIWFPHCPAWTCTISRMVETSWREECVEGVLTDVCLSCACVDVNGRSEEEV